MPDSIFVSYAQNGEDVVLWRALRDVPAGRYVEVGANDPSELSVSRHFYEAGWSGVTIDPVSEYVRRHREARPRDLQVEAAIASTPGELTLHEIPGSGLSTLVDGVSERHARAGFTSVDRTVPARRLDEVLDGTGWAPDSIHWLLVDVEGAEADVMRSIDLTRWRPWVLVVESTAPLSTEQTHGTWEPGVLAAGYEFCLFDGVSRFYVAAEHASRLRANLSYPACALDEFVTAREVASTRQAAEGRATVQDLTRQLVHWRRLALLKWSLSVGEVIDSSRDEAELHRVRGELDAVKRTVSWRVTSPLRSVRRISRRTR